MYTWTEEKNQGNKRKHGFYFSEILDVFKDPHLLEIYDEAHSSLDEDRYISIGCFNDVIILFVVTSDKADGNIQIISARKASTKEARRYYDSYRKSANNG